MHFLFSILFGVLIFVLVPSAEAYTQEECLNCHEKGNPNTQKKISKKEYLKSIHGQNLSCQDCHKGIKDETHQERQGSGLVECKDCHPNEWGARDWWSWQVTSHGKQDLNGNYDKRNCLGCHQGQAAHGEEKPINNQTCFKCHGRLGKEAALVGYIHPRADRKTHPAVFTSMILSWIILVGLGVGGLGFLWTRIRKGRDKR